MSKEIKEYTYSDILSAISFTINQKNKNEKDEK